MTRGERNNNPFNLKQTDIKWQGKKTPSTDAVFEQFTSPVWGIRAGVKDLLTGFLSGRNTVYKIITRFAPVTENDTNAYIKAVCTHLNVNADDVLDLDNYSTMYALAVAIMLHENGDVSYDKNTIDQAIRMAGIVDAPVRTPAQRPETKAAVGIGAATSIAVVGNAVTSIAPAIPLVQQFLTLAPWLASVVAIGVIGYLAYIVYKKHTTGVY